MIAVDLKTLTDAELQTQWQAAADAMNAVYRELTLQASLRAGYNVKHYVKLHRTEEGKRQYRAAQADFDVTEAATRQRFWSASAVCKSFADEAARRGLVQP